MHDDQVLILGIGNLLWADEGFGVRAVESLHAHYRFADNVRLMDGGTQGIYLVQHVREADILVVFDAIDYGLPPGTLRAIEGDAVPNFMGAKKMSLHQTGFQEVLAMAKLYGDYPRHLLLVGVQPQELEDYGGSLRPAVKAQIGPATELALDWLRALGFEARARHTPLAAEQTLAPAQLDLERYEQQRPDRSAACRAGDSRVLADDRYRFDPKPSPLDGNALGVDIDRRGG